MNQQIKFQDGDRTYTCEPGTSRATPDTKWWWVTVSGDAQRYAAFHVQKGDTPKSVQKRVIAYYQQVLADRERPPMPRQQFGRPPAAAAAAAKNAD